MKKIYTIEKDGHPYTYSGWRYSLSPHDDIIRYSDDSSLMSELPKEYYNKAMDTLKRWFVPSNRNCLRHSSYGYKHWLEEAINHYISNNQLKDAMLALGFEVKDYKALNWFFKVSPTQELKEWLIDNDRRW